MSIGYTYKTIQNPAGDRILEAYCGHIHYKENGLFVPVEHALKDAGEFWEMEKASYRLYVNKDFSKPRLILFQNRFEGANHSITYEPYGLAWIHKTNRDDIRIFSTQQLVIGVLEPAMNTIRWENAFGVGLHFEVVAQASGVRKQLVIQSKAALGLPPSNDYVLAVLFKYGGEGLSVRDKDDVEWNQNDFKLMNQQIFTIGEDSSRKSFIHRAQAFYRPGAYPLVGSEIPVAWKRHNNNLFQIKIVPLNVLSSSMYPLVIDTTTTFDTGSGDGSVSKWDSGVWDTTHDATSGAGAFPTVASAGLTTKHDGTNYTIQRLFYPFDTSGLNDSAIIDSVTFNVVCPAKTVTDDDGNDFIRIVQTSQASTSTLDVADFDQCGAVDNPTAGASDTDMSGLSVGGWVSITLNATGRGWINKTGYTKIGLREGHDAVDSPVGNSLECTVGFWFSEVGAPYIPYLSIVHHMAYSQSAAGSMPAASGGMSRLTGKKPAGSMPAASGLIVRGTLKGVAGSFPAASATLLKGMGKPLSGSMPAGSGVVAATGLFVTLVAGAMGAISGAISRATGKVLGGSMPEASGAAAKSTSVSRAGEMPEPSGDLQEQMLIGQTASGIMGAISGVLSAIFYEFVAPLGWFAKKITRTIPRDVTTDIPIDEEEWE